MKQRLLIIGLLVSTSACSASMGRKIDDARVRDIKNCVTTEKDLLAWFGEPSQRGNQNGMPTMQWMYSKTTAGFATGSVEQQNLVVVLNAAGKVVQYQLNPTTFPEAKDTCQSAPPSAQ